MKKLERTEEYYYDGKYSKNFGGTIPNNIKKLKKLIEVIMIHLPKLRFLIN